MKIVKKCWNTFWVVDGNGKMLEAAIGGRRTGYNGENGKHYSTLSDLRTCYRIK